MGELINTNCPNCGAAIQVNPDYPNKMFCQYCGTSFMVKDVINNYTVINNFNQAASTYEDNIKKRNAYVKELEKEVLYFSCNLFGLYNKVNNNAYTRASLFCFISYSKSYCGETLKIKTEIINVLFNSDIS